MNLLKATTLEERRFVNRTLLAIGTPSKTVYSPSEDSFLMLHALSNIELNDLTVCDIGTGTGILGLFCAIKGADVTVTDVDEIALHETLTAAQRLRIVVKPILSDVFAQVTGRFDLALFNPPYLPSEVVLDRAVDGGPDGLVLTRRFLRELPTRLKKNGHGLLLLSSLNNPAKVISEYDKFSFEVLATRQVFFEELQVLDLRLR
ncbi:MAG TPA: HemK2/MTQ2 family protein methyltransferase [Candidatus Bathyarchaeia archaeon]|nr:HemK2/MTQ2 family protein methyltransferase [Candidatus Bathyarchaeia archaeon]